MLKKSSPCTASSLLPFIPHREEPVWETICEIPITNDEEPLVPLSLAPSPIRVFPAYARLGIPGAVPECFVRESVYRKLLAAARDLPAGLGMVVLDGWRPWRVQQYLFETLQEILHSRHPELSESELMIRTREFVSVPSRDPSAPSPHLTGGAVDVTLCDADGLPLDMGTMFDEATAISHTDHYERQGVNDSREAKALEHRRLLYRTMLGQGFTNLPSEWWHYDFGDQLWAYYGGHDRAHYGATELDTIENRWRRQLV